MEYIFSGYLPDGKNVELKQMIKQAHKFNFVIPAIIILVIVAVGGALLAGGSQEKSKPRPKNNTTVVNTSCGPYRKDGIVTINGSQINVETAAGPKELTKGLSTRPCIESNWGMLFDFGRDGNYRIWMKDMRFPIDVAWIDSSHKVVALEIDFKPSTYPEQRVNQALARYVLEIGANKSKELNLGIGTVVHFQKS